MKTEPLSCSAQWRVDCDTVSHWLGRYKRQHVGLTRALMGSVVNTHTRSSHFLLILVRDALWISHSYSCMLPYLILVLLSYQSLACKVSASLKCVTFSFVAISIIDFCEHSVDTRKMHILYLKDVIFLLICKTSFGSSVNSSTSFFRILKFEDIYKSLLQYLYFQVMSDFALYIYQKRG